MQQSSNESSEHTTDGPDNSASCDDQQRIQYLEQSVRFLHNQHQQLVASLHEEVDLLKRKNRELQFCIVMMQQNIKPENDHLRRQVDVNNSSVFHQISHVDSTVDSNMTCVNKEGKQLLTNNDSTIQSISKERHHYNDSHQEKKLDELKLQFMEEEIKHAKLQVDEGRTVIYNLTDRLKTIEHQLAVERTKSMIVPPGQSKAMTSSVDGQQAVMTSSTGLPYNATVEPLLVHYPPQKPRPPTLHECQTIVKYLHTNNIQQTHELKQLKMDLRDVLYSHKWTPDAYLMARAYIVDDDESVNTSLPRIPLKHVTKKLPDAAYYVKDATSFPPMRPVIGNQAIERLKRTQILHKMKTVKQ